MSPSAKTTPCLEVNVFKRNAMWSNTAWGVHCYTAHHVLSESHHYSVHRVCLRVSRITHVTSCINAVWLDWRWTSNSNGMWMVNCCMMYTVLPWEWYSMITWTKNWVSMRLCSPILSPNSMAYCRSWLYVYCTFHTEWKVRSIYCTRVNQHCSSFIIH